MKLEIRNWKLKIPAPRAGFTMVEMLLYMGLLSLLLIMMVDLFASSLDVQLESKATSGVDQDAKFVLSRLTNDIRRADTIAEPLLGATPSGILSIVIDGVTHTYATQSGALILTNQGATNSLNSFETITKDITFQRKGNTGGKNAIHITATIQSKTTRVSGTETKKIETTVGIR